jgi:hypothetical protein
VYEKGVHCPSWLKYGKIVRDVCLHVKRLAVNVLTGEGWEFELAVDRFLNWREIIILCSSLVSDGVYIGKWLAYLGCTALRIQAKRNKQFDLPQIIKELFVFQTP